MCHVARAPLIRLIENVLLQNVVQQTVGMLRTSTLLLLGAVAPPVWSLMLDARMPPSTVQPALRSSRCSPVTLLAKKKAPVKKKKAAAASGGGFGAKTAAPVGPTPAELLKASMTMYKTMERESGKSNSAQAEADYSEGAEEDASTCSNGKKVAGHRKAEKQAMKDAQKEKRRLWAASGAASGA